MRPSMGFADIIGLVGVAAYVAAHFAVQVLGVHPASRVPLALNVIGPVCLIVSLMQTFNQASFLAQCFWLVVTLAGWWRRRALGGAA